MKYILVIVIFFFFQVSLSAQSPHGDNLKPDCSECHNANNWEISITEISFNHNSTPFELKGEHQNIDCGMCHVSPILSEVKKNCFNCHVDIHQQSVGLDCNSCHNSKSWLINSVKEIHYLSRFPLLGAHSIADCEACHPSNSTLNYRSHGIDCYDCHRQDYQASAEPSHIEADYSTNCIECHNSNSYEWRGSGIDHSFFPLTLGHTTNDCSQCHEGNSYKNTSPQCVDCHLSDFQNATNPVHDPVVFSSECTDCHTINYDWQPAAYRIHDLNSFPIYSGKHNGEWKNCAECHTNTNNYSSFSCIDCHEHNRAEMKREHDDERDYIYESNACFECHPRGREEDD